MYLYLKGGGSYGHSEIKTRLDDMTHKASGWDWSPTYGGGVEFAMPGNWTVGLEIMRTEGSDIALTFDNTRLKADDGLNTIMFRIQSLLQPG